MTELHDNLLEELMKAIRQIADGLYQNEDAFLAEECCPQRALTACLTEAAGKYAGFVIANHSINLQDAKRVRKTATRAFGDAAQRGVAKQWPTAQSAGSLH